MSKVAEVMISTSGTMPGKTLRIDRNAPVKIKAVGGVHYVLKDVDADVSPENVTLERVGDDLQVALEGDPLPALTLEDYYALTEAAGIYGVSEDGELYRYVPTNASSDSAALPDGQMTAMALGGNPVSPAEAIDDKDVGDGSSEASEASEKSEKSEKGEKSEESDSDQPVPWWLWGFGGLAVAGGVIAAVAGGGGSSGSSSGGGGQKPTAAPPTNAQALDQVGDTRGVLTDQSVSDDARPVISGTGIAGYTITVYDGTQAIGTTTVAPDGSWSFQPPAPLSDGSHDINVTQQGPDTLPSAPVPVVSVVVDTVAPATPAATVANAADGMTTNQPTPTIAGTGEPGDTVAVMFPGGEVQRTTVAPDGTWSVTPQTALPEGPQSIVITEQDPAGNASTMTLPVVIDAAMPLTPAIVTVLDDVSNVTGSVTNGGETNDARPTISGTIDTTGGGLGGGVGVGNGVMVDIYDNGMKIGTVSADETGRWTFVPMTPLSDGLHSMTVTATDEVGNTSPPSGTFAFTVDTVVPAAPVVEDAIDNAGTDTGPVPAGGTTDDTTPTLNGTTEPGDIVDIYDNGTKIATVIADETGAWSFTPATPLAEGEHSLTVTTTDEAGNVSDPSAPVEFTVDAGLPPKPVIAGATDDVGSITGTISVDGVTDDTMPTLNGTTEPGDIVDVYDNGTKIGTVTADETGAWSFTPETPLADGEHSLTVTTTDEAGNVSEPSAPIAITVDTTVPTTPAIAGATDDAGTITGSIPADGVTDDTTPTLNGTTEAGATVDVYDNGTKIGTVTADETGAWSFTPETPWRTASTA
ncbi:hypothetical protein DFLDMN_000343 [Cupriavidus sp. H19C3]|uniref:Ig-like domain-containing protein n=1 Tax=Cupriavidus sp. H19C3 TaxID=3241603 RepID=UPI003BF85390